MTITIDRQTALDLMERAVNEKGADYIYPGWNTSLCQYQKDGAPSCLVGHALFYAGVSVEDLARMDEGWSDAEPGDSAIEDLVGADDLPFKVTPAALTAFSSAQTLQDRGKPWEHALERANVQSSRERDSL